MIAGSIAAGTSAITFSVRYGRSLAAAEAPDHTRN